jgi:hypothetical protein
MDNILSIFTLNILWIVTLLGGTIANILLIIVIARAKTSVKNFKKHFLVPIALLEVVLACIHALHLLVISSRGSKCIRKQTDDLFLVANCRS